MEVRAYTEACSISSLQKNTSPTFRLRWRLHEAHRPSCCCTLTSSRCTKSHTHTRYVPPSNLEAKTRKQVPGTLRLPKNTRYYYRQLLQDQWWTMHAGTRSNARTSHMLPSSTLWKSTNLSWTPALKTGTTLELTLWMKPCSQ